MSRHRPIQTEEGFSLIELVTTIALGSLVAGTAAIAAVNVLRYQRVVESHGQALQQAQLAVDQLSSQVRSGNVLYQPEEVTGGWELLAYTQANGAQRCAQWEYRSAEADLRFRSWDPNWRSISGGTSDWRVVASGLANHLAGVAPFSVPSDEPYGSRLLEVDLRVNTGSGETVTVTSAATGRNTEYNHSNAVCDDQPVG